MSDTLIAFVGMVVLVSLFLAFIVIYGRWAERRAPKSEEAHAVISHPIGEAAPTPPLIARAGAHIMSRIFGAAGPIEPIPTEQRSYAVEQRAELPGTEDGNDVPDVLELLEQADDDQLLDILAGLRGEDGGYRFAESRVAKFIGGRVEDRLAQVREIRGTEKPPGRLLRVRDERGERQIPIRKEAS